MSVTSAEAGENASAAKGAEAPFADTVLICGKCVKRLGRDGKTIRNSLKQALKNSPWTDVRLVKTSCFSLCPKGGQVLATIRKPGDREPGFAIENALDYLLRKTRILRGDAEEDRNP
jgi:hypothetical protein